MKEEQRMMWKKEAMMIWMMWNKEAVLIQNLMLKTKLVHED